MSNLSPLLPSVPPKLLPLSFTYGEDTHIRVSIYNATFRIHALPLQGTALVEVEFTVVNDKVHSDIEGKFRFPLPEGASVVRYAFEINGKMVDAMSLPNRKAAEVAYREREAGRSVSKTEQVEGNLFETTIFPLQYNKQHQLIITYKTNLVASSNSSDFSWEIVSPFFFEDPLKSIVVQARAYPEDAYVVRDSISGSCNNSKLEGGLVIKIGEKDKEKSKGLPEVIAGNYIGKTHFSVFLSHKYISDKFGPVAATPAASSSTTQKHICVLWDSSQSCKKSKNNANFILDLEKAHKSKGVSVKFSLFTFSTDVIPIAENLTGEETAKSIADLWYDGGTNLAVMGQCFVAQAKKETNYSYFLVCTDGVDNIGNSTRLPAGIPEVGVPVHVISPTETDHVNDGILRCIAFQTAGYYGKANEKTANIIAGVDPTFAVRKVMPTTASEDQLMELLEADDFKTVPDFRLNQEFTFWPVKDNGVLISGILPKSKNVLPDTLQITLAISSSTELHKVSIPLKSALENVKAADGALGCLVGVSHSQNMIEESSFIKFDPDFAQAFIENVGREYNIATPHSSLLLLHDAVQFIDNDVDCPSFHPQHETWKKMKEAKETSKEISDIQKRIKELEKLRQVVGLADTLVSVQNSYKTTRDDIEAQIAATNTAVSLTESAWNSCKSSIDSSYNRYESEFKKVETAINNIKNLETRVGNARTSFLPNEEDQNNKTAITKACDEEAQALTALKGSVTLEKLDILKKSQQDFLGKVKSNVQTFVDPIRTNLISMQTIAREHLAQVEAKKMELNKIHSMHVSEDSLLISQLQQQIEDIKKKEREREQAQAKKLLAKKDSKDTEEKKDSSEADKKEAQEEEKKIADEEPQLQAESESRLEECEESAPMIDNDEMPAAFDLCDVPSSAPSDSSPPPPPPSMESSAPPPPPPGASAPAPPPPAPSSAPAPSPPPPSAPMGGPPPPMLQASAPSPSPLPSSPAPRMSSVASSPSPSLSSLASASPTSSSRSRTVESSSKERSSSPKLALKKQKVDMSEKKSSKSKKLDDSDILESKSKSKDKVKEKEKEKPKPPQKTNFELFTIEITSIKTQRESYALTLKPFTPDQYVKSFEQECENKIKEAVTASEAAMRKLDVAPTPGFPSHAQKKTECKEQNLKANKLASAAVEASSRSYIQPILALLHKDDALGAYQEYLKQRELSNNSTSPSFYIYASRLFQAGECPSFLGMRIITNTIEMNVQDTQMFRSVAYFMLELGLIPEAIQLFRRVQDKAPAEPQSFIDLGLALFMEVRQQVKNGAPKDKVKKLLEEAIAEEAKVLTGTWVSRFSEIEWPAMIWLNWMVAYGEAQGLGDLWPIKEITRTFYIPKIQFDLVVTMGWDTDNTDIDLHVYEPDGTHVYYGNKCGRLSKDFTQGYGPECFVAKTSLKGVYTISAKYFGSSQKSSTTGTTSCVLWSVKNFGKFDSEEIVFRMVRLDANKSEMPVMMVDCSL